MKTDTRMLQQALQRFVDLLTNEGRNRRTILSVDHYELTLAIDDAQRALSTANPPVDGEAKMREALTNIRALAAKRQAEGGPDGNLADIEQFAAAALASTQTGGGNERPE